MGLLVHRTKDVTLLALIMVLFCRISLLSLVEHFTTKKKFSRFYLVRAPQLGRVKQTIRREKWLLQRVSNIDVLIHYIPIGSPFCYSACAAATLPGYHWYLLGSKTLRQAILPNIYRQVGGGGFFEPPQEF